MRVALRIGGEELLLHDVPALHTAPSAFKPVSRSQAVDLLARAVRSAGTADHIRRSVGAVDLPVSRMNNGQLVQWLAARLARGLLWLDTRGPVARIAQRSADHAKPEPPPEEDLTAKKPWPPEPIVPPEYITSAWLESNAVREGRNFLCGKLDGLMYFGFPSTRPTSTIAPEYRNASRLEASEVRNAASEMNIVLTYEMYDPFELTRPVSDIAKTYVAAAQVQAVQIRESILGLSNDLFSLVG